MTPADGLRSSLERSGRRRGRSTGKVTGTEAKVDLRCRWISGADLRASNGYGPRARACIDATLTALSSVAPPSPEPRLMMRSE